MRRIAVLISGGGSNLQALIETVRSSDRDEIGLVVANAPGAYGLERAARAGIEAALVDHRDYDARSAFEKAINDLLLRHGIDFVCLAGFMRVLGADLVRRWEGRMINIHPSLLPSFPGLRTHERALAAGVAVHGCTIHLVRPELDDGPILVQGIVPVLPRDDARSLARRVLEVEHRCWPTALRLTREAPDSAALDRLVVHPLLRAPAGKT